MKKKNTPRWTQRCNETYRVCEANATRLPRAPALESGMQASDESASLTPALAINERVVRFFDEESRTVRAGLSVERENIRSQKFYFTFSTYFFT